MTNKLTNDFAAKQSRQKLAHLRGPDFVRRGSWTFGHRNALFLWRVIKLCHEPYLMRGSIQEYAMSMSRFTAEKISASMITPA
jgi:hypothetical protein